MRTLTVDLGDRSYPIYIGSGIRQQKALFDDAIHGKQVMIVTNETIAPPRSRLSPCTCSNRFSELPMVISFGCSDCASLRNPSISTEYPSGFTGAGIVFRPNNPAHPSRWCVTCPPMLAGGAMIVCADHGNWQL